MNVKFSVKFCVFQQQLELIERDQFLFYFENDSLAIGLPPDRSMFQLFHKFSFMLSCPSSNMSGTELVERKPKVTF